MKKTDLEWKNSLTDDQYRVCREHGTERPFTGEYVDCKLPGTYRCICCGAKLFDADSKFDSGSGWPSYTQPVDKTAVSELTDQSHGMVRTEVRCAECDAHLGHVFPDGPVESTGLRYCINSVSLSLDEDSE